MKKTIEISDGLSIDLECNAATPFVAKKLFGIDLLVFFQNVNNYDVSEQTEIIEKMTFTMAKQAEMPWREVLNFKEEDYIDWLSGYDYEDMVHVSMKATELWNISGKTASTPKN